MQKAAVFVVVVELHHILLLRLTQHSSNLVEVTAPLIAWSGRASSHADPRPFCFLFLFYFYSTRCHEVFQTGPSNSKSATPCLYCCSREIRRMLFTSRQAAIP